MKRQPHRLPAEARHGFGGAELDRGKPISFRLDGRSYEAFEGDTVLSALLAAGAETAGLRHGEPIALDERFSPPVAPAALVHDPTQAVPMDRVPAIADLDLVTLEPPQQRIVFRGLGARLRSLFSRAGRTLGHRLDDAVAFEGPWLQRQPDQTIEADTIVVGGGLAGMSAALAAAAAGGQVILVERRAMLGGDARFFGTVGDEEPPDTTIVKLSFLITKTPAITVLFRTDAFGLSGAIVRAHRVEAKDGTVESRVLALKGARIVLATGTAERLPIFPGNRSPGVAGAVATFHRADRYGIWQGKRAVFSTPHNFTYRLALLAADAGIEVQRIADSRLSPQSRFIDFCKASGITLASGLVPRSLERSRKGPDQLSVGFAIAIEEVTQETASIVTQRLIAAGGWQPRLALWLMAGGGCAFNRARHWLEARGNVDNVALCGAAVGYRSSRACMKSGEQVVAALFGRAAAPVEDTLVDATYESPEAATPIAPWRAGRGVAFLDNGLSFTARPPQPRRDLPAMLPAQMGGLSVADVAAAVQLGAIPSTEAGIVARERCLGDGDVADVGWRVPAASPAAAPPDVPPYLNGRFGPKSRLVTVECEDERIFETGCLLYASSDAADPFAAVGVIVGPAPEGRKGGFALAGRAAFEANAMLFVRDTSGPVAVSITDTPRA